MIAVDLATIQDARSIVYFYVYYTFLLMHLPVEIRSSIELFWIFELEFKEHLTNTLLHFCWCVKMCEFNRNLEKFAFQSLMKWV